MVMESLYGQVLPMGGFQMNQESSRPEERQFCYNVACGKGEGQLWYYFCEDMFAIQKQDFFFYDNFYLKSPCTDFLALQYYESVSGEEFCPYYKLASNTFRAYIGEEGRIFRAAYHKNVPIRSVSISIMPDFYEAYLMERRAGGEADIKAAFQKVMREGGCPELVAILKRIRQYEGSGISARLFYQSKVLEALSIVFDAAGAGRNNSGKKQISKEDETNLKAVAEHLRHNFAERNSLRELSKIACMGTTKLKTTFPVCFGCNISEYITKQRMKRALHLLLDTDLHIAEIARLVGYERADSFSRQFKKSTGMLPRTYRRDALDS